MQPYFTENLAWQRIKALQDAAATVAATGAGAAATAQVRRGRVARWAPHGFGAVWSRSDPATGAAASPCVC